jgi:hypothetical protein
METAFVMVPMTPASPPYHLGRMARGDHGLPKVSPWPLLKQPYSCLLPFWTPQAILLCIPPEPEPEPEAKPQPEGECHGQADHVKK